MFTPSIRRVSIIAYGVITIKYKYGWITPRVWTGWNSDKNRLIIEHLPFIYDVSILHHRLNLNVICSILFLMFYLFLLKVMCLRCFLYMEHWKVIRFAKKALILTIAGKPQLFLWHGAGTLCLGMLKMRGIKETAT